MFAEQAEYRSFLLQQPAEEILHHTYEYTMREDILLSLEYNDLNDAQCKALLKSKTPLSDVYHHFEKQEFGHMEDIWQSMQGRANQVLREDFIKEHSSHSNIKER